MTWPGRASGLVGLLLVFLAAGRLSAIPLNIVCRLPVGARAQHVNITIAPLTPKLGLEARSLEVDLPEPAVFDAPVGSAWNVEVEAAGYWAKPQLRVADAAVAALPIELRVAGTIAGAVHMPPGQKPPAKLTVRFRSAPGAKPALDEVAAPCPIVDGKFHCSLPAGVLDLRLRAAGYLTHYRWGASVPLRKTLNLGILDLKPGAQVVGWIEAPDRAFRFADVSVTLAPQALGSVDAPSRTEALVQREAVDSHGFFDFTGLAPGSYSLVAKHSRFAPKVVMPVQVRSGSETELHPLTLEPAVPFEVRIDPPRDPYGQRWGLELTLKADVAGLPRTVKNGPADAEGVFRAEGLEPGRYYLRVEGGYRSRWAFEEIDIGPNSPRHELHLPFVQVEGKVRLGGKPLHALLWFGGHQASERVAAKSDAEGRFSVVLPEQERWPVEVFNTQLHVDAAIPTLEIRRAPGESVAKVSIDVPDTSVSGVVIDEEGKPVAGARVETNGPAGDDAESDEQGRFEMIGLAAGDWVLQAASADRSASSETVHFHLDKEPVEGLKIVLRKDVRLKGMVVGPGGEGVPGARIEAFVDNPPLAFPERQAFSDVSGVFELRLPAQAEGVYLSVFPPGFALMQQRIEVHSAEPLLVQVSPIGGTLTLRYSGGDLLPKGTRIFLTSVAHDFALPGAAFLASWAEANGASTDDPHRLSIPMLEPGPYTACFPAGNPLNADGTFRAGLKRRCVSGTLGALGELVLDLEVKGPDKKRVSPEGGAAPGSPGGPAPSQD